MKIVKKLCILIAKCDVKCWHNTKGNDTYCSFIIVKREPNFQMSLFKYKKKALEDGFSLF